MRESCIDDPVGWNADYDFVAADFRQQSILGPQSLICSLIQIKQILQMLIVVSDFCHSHAVASRVEPTPDRLQSVNTSAHHVIERGSPPKIRFVFGSRTHSSAGFSPCKMWRDLKMPIR